MRIALPAKTETRAAVSILLLLVVITVFNPLFISSYNLGNLLDALNTIFLLGIGLTFVIMCGCIDLSVGSMLSLSSILFVLMLNALGIWAFPLVIAAGIVQGLLVGLIFVGLKIPSFIASFGMLGVYQSLAILLSRGQTVGVSRKVIPLLDFINIELLGPIKIMHLVTLVIFFLFYSLRRYTAFGKRVAAIGNGEMVAWYSGMPVGRTKVTAFMLSGLSASLCAIVLCSRMYTGDPNFGIPYLLIVIASVVVGGTSLSGGSGGVLNTLLGALLIAAVQNGMHILGISVYYQEIVIGIILMGAISLTIDKASLVIIK